MDDSFTLKWLYLDLNSYFASVEQQLRPELRGKPVAVLPVMTRTTCAIAASYEAKAFGVKTGTMIYEARKLCPDLHMVEARHDKYVEYHHKILAEVDRHIPVTKVCSIDEVACRLDKTEADPERAMDLARRIKQGIRDNVGVCLNSSVGIAPNRFLAKVASNMKKPDGLTVLEYHCLRERLFALPLRALPGIGRNMEKRLNRAGIFSIEALWNLVPKHARRVWNSVEGERFWYALHGYDFPALETERRTVGHSHMLAPELRPPDKARIVGRRLTAKAVSRLRRIGYYASHFHLSVRREDLGKWQGDMKVMPSQDSFVFLEALESLWQTMQREAPAGRIKQVSVCLFGLVADVDYTPDFFSATPPKGSRTYFDRQKLFSALDQINQRYGRDTVMIGSQKAPVPVYTGVKVAFTRIPDAEEFQE